MLTHQKLINKPRKLKLSTGLTPEQFLSLSERLLPLWGQSEEKRLFRPDRKRAIGAGNRYKLRTIEDKLLMVLLFYRVYCTYDLLGLLFDLDGTNIGRAVKRLTPLVEQAADPVLKTYLKEAGKDQKKIRDWREFVEKYPDLVEIATDGTEQTILRPTGKRKQRRYYSGKKKRHTLKTQVTVSKSGRILDISKTYPGRVHDKKIADQEKTPAKVPKETKQFLDKGYDGLVDNYPQYDIRLPHKRRRNSPPLTRGQKQANTLRSKRRIVSENVIAKLKKYQILAQIFRSDKDEYNQTFRNIAALSNFRLAAVPVTNIT